MRITFILPTDSSFPVSGFRGAYKYASFLDASFLERRGYQVAVVHPHRVKPQVSLRPPAETIGWKAPNRVTDRPLRRFAVIWVHARRGVYVLTFRLTSKWRMLSSGEPKSEITS